MLNYPREIVIMHTDNGIPIFEEWLVRHNLNSVVLVTPFTDGSTFLHFKDDSAYTMLCLSFKRSVDDYVSHSGKHYERFLIDVTDND